MIHTENIDFLIRFAALCEEAIIKGSSRYVRGSIIKDDIDRARQHIVSAMDCLGEAQVKIRLQAEMRLPESERGS